MLLGNEAIRKEVKEGRIFISPFEKEQVRYCSYDVRLDKFFCIPKGLSADGEIIAEKIIADKIEIPPLSRILASTMEQIGSLSEDINTKIYAKSSFGRHGLEVSSCGAWGDPGYASHWTGLIFNKNTYPVTLRRGTLIGQVCFTYVEGCNSKYVSKYNNYGKMRETYSDEERFLMMLPKPLKVKL